MDCVTLRISDVQSHSLSAWHVSVPAVHPYTSRSCRSGTLSPGPHSAPCPQPRLGRRHSRFLTHMRSHGMGPGLATCPQGSSMMWQVSEPPSFLRLDTIPLHGRTLFSIHPSPGGYRVIPWLWGDIHGKFSENEVIKQIV